MAEYQNIFTQIQVKGPLAHGAPIDEGIYGRSKWKRFSKLIGRFGNSQIGPIYFGWLGIASTIFFLFAFFSNYTVLK